MDSFDFNAWAALARTAPDELEQKRRNIVENQISNSENIHHLRGLQCRIDLERGRGRTPLKPCLRLSTLMWDTFMDLHNALNTLVENEYESASTSSS